MFWNRDREEVEMIRGRQVWSEMKLWDNLVYFIGDPTSR